VKSALGVLDPWSLYCGCDLAWLALTCCCHFLRVDPIHHTNISVGSHPLSRIVRSLPEVVERTDHTADVQYTVHYVLYTILILCVRHHPGTISNIDIYTHTPYTTHFTYCRYTYPVLDLWASVQADFYFGKVSGHVFHMRLEWRTFRFFVVTTSRQPTGARRICPFDRICLLDAIRCWI
jgi:hypothetical protein